MFYALGWLAVFSLAALWSLAAWALHAVTAWTVSNAAVLAGDTGAIEGLRLPEWLGPWVPTELVQALASMLSAFRPAIDALLGWAPDLAGGLSAAIWVVWAIGSALLLVLGLGLSAMIAVWQRGSGMKAATPGRSPLSSQQRNPWTRSW